MRVFSRSLRYAAAGVRHALLTQRNMRIHFAAALLAFGLALYLRIDAHELLFIIFAVTLVLMAEMFNTAVEAVVDLHGREIHPLARAAKDVAAGAVLVAAINALVVAYLVFYPRLSGYIVHWYRGG